jgi:transcription elongation factor Elf1
MDEQTIAFKFPELEDTGEYWRFDCEFCGITNGSTIHRDGQELVVVCGECWKKQGVR